MKGGKEKKRKGEDKEHGNRKKKKEKRGIMGKRKDENMEWK